MQTSGTIQMLLFGASIVFQKKQINTKLMLCKPLFIIRGRVKGFLKVVLQYKNEALQLQKWAWHMHNEQGSRNHGGKRAQAIPTF